MKDLKFKVYIKSIRQTVEVLGIDFEKEIIYHEEVDWDIKMNKEIPTRKASPFSDCNIMQYTGAKDHNKKDIYEGDILRCKLVEKYQEHYGVVVFLPINLEEFTSIEVVGNIYRDSKYLI